MPRISGSAEERWSGRRGLVVWWKRGGVGLWEAWIYNMSAWIGDGEVRRGVRKRKIGEAVVEIKRRCCCYLLGFKVLIIIYIYIY